MEGVQPRIDDAQGNHKREGIGADDARSRPLTEYLAVDRPVDRDMPLGTIAMTRPFSKSQFAKRLQTPGLAQLPSALLKLPSGLPSTANSADSTTANAFLHDDCEIWV